MATGTTAEQTIDVVTPAAGESVTEGTILEWHVKVGDPIKLDDTIVEISTDKVDVELPSPASGTVSEILVAGGRHGDRRPGDRADRGRRRRRRTAQPRATARPRSDERDGGESPAHGDARAASGDRESAPARLPDGVKVSPVAARAAAVEGVDLANVSGSGPAGTDHEGRRALRRAARNGAAAQRARSRAATARATAGAPSSQLLKGGAAALARYMEQSLRDPHRDELPHAHRHRARRAPARAEGGRAQGLLHPPDRLRDRARRRGHAGDGQPLRRDRRQAAPRRRTGR